MSTQQAIPKQFGNASRSKNVPYFQSEIESSLTPAGRELFETYSHIPPAEVEPHIYKIVGGPFSPPPIPKYRLTSAPA